MENTIRTAAVAVILAPLSANAGITLSDMYMSNSDGVVYRVDGTTLQATEVFQFNDIRWPVQIEYMGNGQIAGNMTIRIDAYDLNTGVQETLVTSTDFDPQAEFALASGLEILDDGSIMTSVWFVIATALWAGTGFYDPATQTATSNNYGYLIVNDLYQIDGSLTLASVGTNTVSIYDYETEVVIDTYTSDIPINSFIENNGHLLVLSDNGELYQFDYLTGAMSLHGTITGFEGDSNSITIPTPSSLALIGLGLGALARRRR